MAKPLNPKFAAYVAPAAKYSQVWRLIAGLLTTAALYIAAIVGMLWVFGWFGISVAGVPYGRSTPLETTLFLSTFFAMGLAVLISARIFQRRGLASLLGPDLRQVWVNFQVSASILFAVVVVWVGVGSFFSEPIANLPFRTWLFWLPTSLILVLVQTSAEELVFRGYLQQQLAARFSSRWIWWFLPSILFGLAHYNPDSQGSNAWLVVADTCVIGLVAADLTARTGNLGAAIGLHFVNNVMALLITSLSGSISGLSLYISPFSMDDTAVFRSMLISDILVFSTLYAIYVLIDRRIRF